MAVIQDAWDSANNPQMPNDGFWGKVEMQAKKVGLVKGVGKEDFDPTKHQKAWTSIEIFIEPLNDMNVANLNACSRNLLAESNEYRKIVLESIKALGIQDVREINGRWVHVETVPTGETYVKDGQTRDKTMFKFMKLFANEDECRKDFNGDAWTPVPAASAPAGAPAAAPKSSERDVAYKFLIPICSTAWRTSNNDMDAALVQIGKKIAALPMLAKHFDIHSPEIMDLLIKQAAQVA